MKYSRFIWDAADDPDGNVQHVAEHDLTVDDVAAVFSAPVSKGNSDSSGLPAVWGFVPDGDTSLLSSKKSMRTRST
jgi:hypothetical protein